MIDLLITNGTVVSEGLMIAADVSIVGKEIQGLGKPGAFGREAKRIIDAQGCYVVPGAIDPHTHLYRESKGVPVPAVDVQSVAAAHGGPTTFIDFTNAPTKVGLMDAVQARRG